MQIGVYVGLAHGSEQVLADSLRQVGLGHAAEADVAHTCSTLADWCDEHVEALAPIRQRYGEKQSGEPERLHVDALPHARTGPVGLLRDLQDLSLLVTLVHSTWEVLGQAAQGARDHELLDVVQRCDAQTQRQQKWLETRIKQAAPQALLVAT